jgi:peroxiredoxin Q/BCP
MIASIAARIAAASVLALVVAVPANAQQAQAQPAGPKVGDMAPDFTGIAAAKSGTLPAPAKLAELKGKTVILAFFPRARTSGCTMQMESYRDQYQALFNGGKDVVLFGVSNDADTTLTAWANEKNFPFQVISDKDGGIGRAYGAMTASSRSALRYLYVIGPDGKITHAVKPVNPWSPEQYAELGAAVKTAMATVPGHHE